MDIDAYLAKRNRILSDFDLMAGMELMGCADVKVARLAMHQARLICSQIAEEKRRESQKWLADRGCKFEDGKPIVFGDPLP